MKIVGIIGCILIIIGFFLAILQAFIHANDLSDKYQSIIEFGDSAIIYGLICLLANKTAQNDYYLKNKK